MFLKGQVLQYPAELKLEINNKIIKTLPAGAFLTVSLIGVMNGDILYGFEETTVGNFTGFYKADKRFKPIQELTEEEIIRNET